MEEVYSIHYLGEWWTKPWAVLRKYIMVSGSFGSRYQSPTYQRLGQYVLLKGMV